MIWVAPSTVLTELLALKFWIRGIQLTPVRQYVVVVGCGGYPRNLAEFEARFSTEAACREYLVRLRWPEGFCCPRCGGQKTWPLSEVLRQCSGCSYQSSVTAGTI